MEVPRQERLKEFFRRLAEAPEARTFDEAMTQIANVLNDVEDEFTSIPYDPANWQTDGRLYPPQPDNIRSVPEHGAVKRLRSRSHNTFIGENGSIEIQETNGRTVFQKAGADGRTVWELG